MLYFDPSICHLDFWTPPKMLIADLYIDRNLAYAASRVQRDIGQTRFLTRQSMAPR
jgi:hypothetical protein